MRLAVTLMAQCYEPAHFFNRIIAPRFLTAQAVGVVNVKLPLTFLPRFIALSTSKLVTLSHFISHILPTCFPPIAILHAVTITW